MSRAISSFQLSIWDLNSTGFYIWKCCINCVVCGGHIRFEFDLILVHEHYVRKYEQSGRPCSYVDFYLSRKWKEFLIFLETTTTTGSETTICVLNQINQLDWRSKKLEQWKWNKTMKILRHDWFFFITSISNLRLMPAPIPRTACAQ